MKRIFALVAALAVLTMALTACGKSEFGVTENTEKRMVVTAENAPRDAFFMVGSLEAEEGDRISINANLTKGSVKVEIIASPEEQSIEEVPEFDSEPVIMLNAEKTDFTDYTVPAGSYMLRATCLEKATGTIVIEVTPAS